MRIALVSPVGGPDGRSHPLIGHDQGTRPNPFRLDNLYSMPSLALLTLEALLADAPFECQRFDGDRGDDPGADDLAAFDAVLFTGMSRQADTAASLSRSLRARGIPTIQGGIHATFHPDLEAFSSVFQGELEPWRDEFVTDLLQGKLSPVYTARPPADTFHSPVPRYAPLPTGTLFPVQFSRGCPCDCAFCVATKAFGPALRLRPIHDIEAILSAILQADPRPALFIADDNMFRARNWTLDVLRCLKPAGVRFMAHGELSLARDPEMLAALQAAGCVALLTGIESPDAASVGAEAPFKGNLVEQAAEAVRVIQDAGIGVTGSFMVGFDGDDAGVFERISRFAADTAMYEICVKVLTPFPGTALRQRLAAENRLTAAPFAHYDARHLVFQARNLTAGEIDAGLSRIADDFVLPDAVKRRIRTLKKRNTEEGDRRQESGEENAGLGKDRHEACGMRHAGNEENTTPSAADLPMSHVPCPMSCSTDPDSTLAARRSPHALKVVLVQPAEPPERLDSPLGKGFRAALAGSPGRDIHSCPPLALYQLAAWLAPEDEWCVVDEAAGDRLEDPLPADLVLISALTCQAERALELAAQARAAGAKTVIGGPHATSCPETFRGRVDSVVGGEAEEIIAQVLADARAGCLQPEYTAPGPADLSHALPARYDCIPGADPAANSSTPTDAGFFPRSGKEPARNHGVWGLRPQRVAGQGPALPPYPFIPLQVSRGCPRGCRYCASSTLHGKRLRSRPLDVVKAELEMIARHHPGCTVYIVDDNFALLEQSTSVMTELKRWNLPWFAYGDPSLVDRPDWLDQAAACGCRRLLVGFETPDPGSLTQSAPGKSAYAGRYGELVTMIQSRGIGGFGGFIVGFDGDGPDCFERIASFLEDTLLAEFCLSFLTPFPGTDFFREMEAAGRIRTGEWRFYDGFHPVLVQDSMTPEDAVRGAETVLQRYLAPALVAKRTAYFKEIYRRRAY